MLEQKISFNKSSIEIKFTRDIQYDQANVGVQRTLHNLMMLYEWLFLAKSKNQLSQERVVDTILSISESGARQLMKITPQKSPPKFGKVCHILGSNAVLSDTKFVSSPAYQTSRDLFQLIEDLIIDRSLIWRWLRVSL